MISRFVIGMGVFDCDVILPYNDQGSGKICELWRYSKPV